MDEMTKRVAQAIMRSEIQAAPDHWYELMLDTYEDRAKAAIQAMGVAWQPIKTAPRDGRWITVVWRSQFFDAPCCATAHFDKQWDSWYLGGNHRMRDDELDLWAPIPELPEGYRT